MPDQLRHKLEQHLRPTLILGDELGGGGMSRVFVARETALARDVVVKVLHPDLAGGVNADRFRREIELSARLQHPHIVPILAAGEVDGIPFFTMPYVTGRSLRDRLGHASGPFPIDEAVSILRDVARALSYAHGHGIVHRDIKPDNVLLTDGAATVTDFGVAKAFSSARGLTRGDGAEDATAGQLTEIGVTIGTPTYMAPEQAAGDPNVDHRTDVYSWGVLAYEMLSGKPPFAATSTQKLFVAHLTEPPPPLDARRLDCPPSLASLVMQALEKDPDHRPESAGEVVRRLNEGGAPSPSGVHGRMATSADLGRAAFERREWQQAFDRLSAADPATLGAADLERLGDAAYSTGRYDAAQHARERAYGLFRDANEMTSAARVALAMALEHLVRGRTTLTNGWLESAERALVGQPESYAHGYSMWLRAQVAVVIHSDAEGGLALAEQAMAIGRRLNDVDIEMFGRSIAGRALVHLGRVDEGMVHLDAAMVSATSGEVKTETARYAMCNLLCGCHELGDFDRAAQWSDATEHSSTRQSLIPASGECRAHRATILRVRGDWDGAEAAAKQSATDLAGEIFHGAIAVYEIGEVRLRRGDYAAAAEAFHAAQERGHSGQPGHALLALAQGKLGLATSMLQSALEDAKSPLLRAALLPARVEIALAAKDLGTARTAADELNDIAIKYRSRGLGAARDSVAGMLALAGGDVPGAAAHVRRALKHWKDVHAPYEAALARVLLAETHSAAGDRDSAIMELTTAKPVFEKLGAARDIQRVDALLRKADIH